MDSKQKTEILARVFAYSVREALGEDRLAMVNLENETSPFACASHDYIDSNVNMDEAFELVTGSPCDASSQENADLINAAWDMAKGLGFYALENPAAALYRIAVAQWATGEENAALTSWLNSAATAPE